MQCPKIWLSITGNYTNIESLFCTNHHSVQKFSMARKSLLCFTILFYAFISKHVPEHPADPVKESI